MHFSIGHIQLKTFFFCFHRTNLFVTILYGPSIFQKDAWKKKKDEHFCALITQSWNISSLIRKTTVEGDLENEGTAKSMAHAQHSEKWLLCEEEDGERIKGWIERSTRKEGEGGGGGISIRMSACFMEKETGGKRDRTAIAEKLLRIEPHPLYLARISEEG